MFRQEKTNKVKPVTAERENKKVEHKDKKNRLKQNRESNINEEYVDWVDIAIDEVGEDIGEVRAANVSDMKTERLDIPPCRTEVGLASNIGKREYQQDAAIVSAGEKLGLTRTIAVLCDGMGGMDGGELASNMCAGIFYNDFLALTEDTDWYDFLVYEAQKADEQVSLITDEYGEPMNAGCTLTAVVIDDSSMHFVSVGDSRIYVIRDHVVTQITRDHNYLMILNEKLEKGEITAEEVMDNVNKEALISYIGMGGLNIVDANDTPIELKSDDFVLMCSDGLYRVLGDKEIEYIIDSNRHDMALAAQALVDTAVYNGFEMQDNTSAILIKYI